MSQPTNDDRFTAHSNPGTLDSREIPTPQHSWETAKHYIQQAFAAAEHEWVELDEWGADRWFVKDLSTRSGGS